MNTLDNGPPGDFLFEVEEGTRLVGDETKRTIRFKSVSHPDRFLRHRFERLVLQGPEAGGPFEEDSTFFNEDSPLGPSAEHWRRFRTVNFQDRFIRHRDFHLFAERVADGNEDTAFQLVEVD